MKFIYICTLAIISFAGGGGGSGGGSSRPANPKFWLGVFSPHFGVFLGGQRVYPGEWKVAMDGQTAVED
jgi:hypothetical protein